MTTSNATDRGLDRRFLAFLACFYGAWCLRVVLLMPVDDWIEAAWLQQCWSQGLRVSLWVLPVFLYIRYIDRANPLTFLRLDVLPKGRPLVMGVGIAVGFLALCIAAAFLFQGAALTKLTAMTGARWASLLGWVAIVAAAEEILFRGFIFRKLRERFPFQRANLLNAVLFLLIHVPGWLYMQGPHWGLLTLSVSILIVGYVLGLLTEVTKSLWPPIVLHALNNVISVTLLS
ncbi:MAG: protease family protein [Candidatus Hydrogenedentes bacterium]|nr:protease family protein [Candidatus Hydrogenedentota bacterium]